jgi:hypothetical protein
MSRFDSDSKTAPSLENAFEASIKAASVSAYINELVASMIHQALRKKPLLNNSDFIIYSSVINISTLK